MIEIDTVATTPTSHKVMNAVQLSLHIHLCFTLRRHLRHIYVISTTAVTYLFAVTLVIVTITVAFTKQQLIWCSTHVIRKRNAMAIRHYSHSIVKW